MCDNKDFDKDLKKLVDGPLPWSNLPADVAKQADIDALDQRLKHRDYVDSNLRRETNERANATNEAVSELRRDNEQLHAENDQLRTVLDFLVHVVCSNKTGNELQALIDVVRNGSIIDASDLHKWITGEYFNVSITWGEEK